MRSAEVSRELVEYVAAEVQRVAERRTASRLWRRSILHETCHRRPRLSGYPAAARAAAHLRILSSPKSLELWTTLFERKRDGLMPF
jgi:predicted Rdx family selenoprotein